jgi:hypothetical protein
MVTKVNMEQENKEVPDNTGTNKNEYQDLLSTEDCFPDEESND